MRLVQIKPVRGAASVYSGLQLFTWFCMTHQESTTIGDMGTFWRLLPFRPEQSSSGFHFNKPHKSVQIIIVFVFVNVKCVMWFGTRTWEPPLEAFTERRRTNDGFPSTRRRHDYRRLSVCLHDFICINIPQFVSGTRYQNELWHLTYLCWFTTQDVRGNVLWGQGKHSQTFYQTVEWCICTDA
jgi:hypothetical protein